MMLSNLLGVVLAFVTVLLLLSLVVMALVQFTQAALRLRSRNLLVGVSWLLQSLGVTGAGQPAASSPLRRDRKLREAAHLLNEASDVHRRLAPGRDPNAMVNVIRGPKVSWVEPADLAKAVVAKRAGGAADGGAPAVSEADVIERFRKLEPALSDRFSTIAQQWTAAWALVVAFAFQVSTPALLHTLAVSETRRQTINALVPDIVRQAESAIPSAMAGDFVDVALTQLARDYPGHTALFDQVSGSTDSRERMLEELRAVLSDVSEREAIVARYAVIIDQGSIRDIDSAVTTANTAIDTLDIVGIRFWGEGWDFYANQAKGWQNLFGVLMTALLLSFGAPFWFEQVKNLANLRSAAAKSKP